MEKIKTKSTLPDKTRIKGLQRVNEDRKAAMRTLKQNTYAKPISVKVAIEATKKMVAAENVIKRDPEINRIIKEHKSRNSDEKYSY